MSGASLTIAWTIRALPLAGIAIGAHRSLFEALAAGALAYAAACVLAFLLYAASHSARTQLERAASASASPTRTNLAAAVSLDSRRDTDTSTPAPSVQGGTTPGPPPQAAAPSECDGWDVHGPRFTAAREAAALRDGGVLAGSYVVIDGVLLCELRPVSAQEYQVIVEDDFPGAEWNALGCAWVARVPAARVQARAHIRAFARHANGAALELERVRGGQVDASWFRGENGDDPATIPAGFTWEKNDDYYRGSVSLDDLHSVSFEVRTRATLQGRDAGDTTGPVPFAEPS